MSLIAKHIVFTGRVQGVGFRFTALNVAKRYQLGGMVRNVMNGSVEMIAQGPAEDVADCIRDIQGTYESQVTETKVNDVPLDPQYNTEFKLTF